MPWSKAPNDRVQPRGMTFRPIFGAKKYDESRRRDGAELGLNDGPSGARGLGHGR